MASVKVTLYDTIRRFSVPKNVTWSILQSRIRTSFSLPPSIPITLLYTDEDQDVITLSTDMELRDIMNEHADKENPTLRFQLEISPEDSVVAFDDVASVTTLLSIDTLSTEEPQQQSHQEEPELHSLPEELHANSHASLMNLPTFLPTISSDEKGKHNSAVPLPVAKENVAAAARDDGPSYTNDSESEMSELSHEFTSLQTTEQPFLALAEQFQKLLDQFRSILDNNPQLINMANNVMETIRQNITVDIEAWKQRLASLDEAYEPQPSPPGRHHMQNQAGSSQTGMQGSNVREHERAPSTDLVQRLQRMQREKENSLLREQQRAEAQRSTAPSPINQQIQDYTRDPSEQAPEITQEPQSTDSQNYEFISHDVEYKEQLELLFDMGFVQNEAETLELLGIYEGDVNQVIEILIERQSQAS